jgi:ABC-type glycerol-3-phosphate transport system substrate-binding protein
MFETLRASFEEKKTLWLVGGGIALLLIIGLIAYLVFSRPQQTGTVATPEVELTWWKVDYNQDHYKGIIDNFKKLPGNSKVEIKIDNKSADKGYYSDLIKDFARGIGPDIFSLRNDDLIAYKEFLSPIDIFRNKILTDYRTNFVQLAVRDTMDKDKVYGITSYVDNLQLYYNENLLNQNRIPNPPKNWSELTRQVPQLSKRGIGSDSFIQSTIALGTGGRTPEGTPNIELHSDIVPTLIFQNGGQLYDYQDQKSIFGEKINQKDAQTGLVTGGNLNNIEVSEDSPTFKAVRFYLDFADPTTARYSWNTSSEKSGDMFVQGKLAYSIQYKSFADEIKRKNSRLPFQVTDLPQLDTNNQRTFGRFYMDSLNRSLNLNAQQPNNSGAKVKYQKAQEFMEYLSRNDNQKILASKSGLPSSNRAAIADQLKGDQTIRTFAAGALYADNYYKPDVVRSEKLWSDLFERIQYNNVPLTESIRQAVKEYNLIINSRTQIRS